MGVGGTGVSVGGTGVGVDGTDVAVGGTGVSVGGTGVGVAGTGVSVGGTGVSVGGTGVIADTADPDGAAHAPTHAAKSNTTKIEQSRFDNLCCFMVCPPDYNSCLSPSGESSNAGPMATTNLAWTRGAFSRRRSD